VREVGADAQNYRQFFEKQKDRAIALDRRGQSVRIAIFVALAAALILLRSPIYVWIWVLFLYGVTWYGLDGLRKALRVTAATLSSLEEVGRFLGTLPPPSREQIIGFINGKIDPNDESDVPEALSAFYSGQQNSESVRALANSAFSLPASELSVAQFFRTALVLGGLFGTVMFFAVELGGAGILSGNLSKLLPGLQGALASTLTGILGSIAVGYLSSAVDQVIERSIWETESLIGGPFARALQVSTEERAVVNEVQLWQQLIEEVRKLRMETTESYAKVATDVTGHSLALQTLSSQLAELPAVQVPPQLASLDDVVRRFRDGAELLNTSATTLVNAVGAIGVYAPAKTLQELEAIREKVTSMQGDMARSLNEMRQDVGSAKQLMSGGIEDIRERTAGISPALLGLESKLDNVQYEVGGAAASLQTLKDAAQRTERSLYTLQERVPESRSISLGTVADAGEASGASVGGQPIAASLEAMNATQRALTASTEAFARRLDELSEQHRVLGMLNRRMALILTWQERASRAPLMRFLTLPFARSRQVERPDGA
jgi:hypothetical protein